MKDKKGFTLIELLAVIVILAVIALIATPIILNVIDNAKQGSFKDSAYGILEAVDFFVLNYNIDNNEESNFSEIIIEYIDGIETITIDGIISEKHLEYKGSKPKTGKIVVTNDNTKVMVISDGKNCATTSNSGIDTAEGECTNQINIIRTPEDLNNIRNNLNGIYIIVNEINLDGFGNWSAVGNAGTPFTGKLFGGGNTIKNFEAILYGTQAGFFGAIKNAEISKLTFQNVKVRGTRYVGTLAGMAIDSIVKDVHIIGNEESYALATDTTVSYLGGLIGHASAIDSDIKIENCSVKLNIDSNTSADVGGLIGLAIGGTIRKNYVYSEINCGQTCGSLIGKVEREDSILVEENYTAGTLTFQTLNGAGLIGSIAYNSRSIESEQKIIKNNYIAVEEITSSGERGAGLIGQIWVDTAYPIKLTIENNYVKSRINVPTSAASFIVQSVRGEITARNNYFDKDTANTNKIVGSATAYEGITGLTTSQMKTATPFNEWDTNIWNFSNDCYPTLKNVGGNQREYLGC